MFTSDGKSHTYAVLVERDIMDLNSLLNTWADENLSKKLQEYWCEEKKLFIGY